MNRLMDVLAALSVASMLVLAFTGWYVWAPLKAPGDADRLMLLMIAHIAPVAYAVIRRT